MSQGCDGEHLWASDGVVGPDEVEKFTCSRCQAKGEECPVCDGVGEDSHDAAGAFAGEVWDCEKCQGTGIIEATR
jgi:DnaJ-class molecular chaperone